MENNQKLKKLILSLLLITIILSFTISAAYAETISVTAEYQESNNSNYSDLADLHPSDTVYISKVCETFNASIGGYLDTITIAISKRGSPVADLRMTVEGTGDSLNAYTNGTIYATSTNTIAASSLQVYTDGVKNDTFLFDGTYELIAGQKYCFTLYAETAMTLDASNDVVVRTDTTSPGFEGYYSHYTTAGWLAPSTAIDMLFRINVTDTSAGSGGSSSSDDIDIPELSGELAEFLVPVVVVLLPVFLLAFFTKKLDKWILIIGLTIGVALGYIFMPEYVPLWLVFLITIGLVGLAYQSVKGGGAE